MIRHWLALFWSSIWLLMEGISLPFYRLRNTILEVSGRRTSAKVAAVMQSTSHFLYYWWACSSRQPSFWCRFIIACCELWLAATAGPCSLWLVEDQHEVLASHSWHDTTDVHVISEGSEPTWSSVTASKDLRRWLSYVIRKCLSYVESALMIVQHLSSVIAKRTLLLARLHIV